MNYSFTSKNKNVYKDGQFFISFPSKVEKILPLDNLLVILVSNNLAMKEQNVFCCDLSKELKWQIDKPIKLHNDNYFSGIYLRDPELYAYSVSGIEYHLDKESGAILKKVN
jgi:hypothetical protein